MLARLARGPLAVGREVFALLGVLLAAGAIGGPARSLLPVYLERDLGWVPPAIAALTAARLLAGAASAPIGGALAASAGARRTIWLGLIGLPVAAGLYLTLAAPALVILVILAGLADGVQSTGSQAYLVARANRATIGLATGLFFVGSTLGGALGNLAAGTILRVGGFAGLGPATLAGGLLVLVGAAALPADGAQQARQRQTLGGSLAAYRPLLRTPIIRQLGLLRFLSTCFWGTATLLWPLLIARLSGDAATAALFGTVSLTVAVAAQLGIGRLIDIIGPGTPAAILAVLVPTNALLSAVGIAAGSLPILFTVGVIGTAVSWSLSGTTLPLIRAAAPAGQATRAVGLLHLLWSLAMLTGTILGGWLVVVNPALPFWTVAALNIPAAVAALRVRRAIRTAEQGAIGSAANTIPPNARASTVETATEPERSARRPPR